MATPQAINLSAINEVKRNIHLDLVENMAGLTSEELTKIGVNILTGIENIDTKFVYMGNKAVARAYEPGKKVRANVGKAVQRDLKVYNVITGVPDNIQNYREKQPISTLGVSSNGLSASNIEIQLRNTTIAFGNQLIAGAFHAVRSTTTDSALNMYNGFCKGWDQDITDSLISTTAGNLITLAPVSYANQAAPTDTECVAAYDRFITFVRKMDKDLRKVATIICPVLEEAAIIRGYSLKFANAQAQIINMGEFVSHEAKTVKLVGTDLLGLGSKLVAYRPNNLEFGLDLTGAAEPSDAYIKITESSDDPLNEILISMQVAAGTRTLDFNKESLFMTADAVTPETDLVKGDGVYEYGSFDTFTPEQITALKALVNS